MDTTIAIPARKRANPLAVLRAFALLAVLAFSAAAQADPVELERIMQIVRSEHVAYESNLQQAYAHLDSGQAAEAQQSLALTRASTTALNLALAELDAEMKRSMQQGEYTNKQALAIAIAQGDYAKSHIEMIDVYVGMMQTQPHPFTRALIDSSRPLFDRRIEQLELELAKSQA